MLGVDVADESRRRCEASAIAPRTTLPRPSECRARRSASGRRQGRRAASGRDVPAHAARRAAPRHRPWLPSPGGARRRHHAVVEVPRSKRVSAWSSNCARVTDTAPPSIRSSIRCAALRHRRFAASRRRLRQRLLRLVVGQQPSWLASKRWNMDPPSLRLLPGAVGLHAPMRRSLGWRRRWSGRSSRSRRCSRLNRLAAAWLPSMLAPSATANIIVFIVVDLDRNVRADCPAAVTAHLHAARSRYPWPRPCATSIPSRIGRRDRCDLPQPADAVQLSRGHAQSRPARHRHHRSRADRPRLGVRAGSFELVVRRWSWPAPTASPLQLQVRRPDLPLGRCLALADGFYEFDRVRRPEQKTKNRWLFTDRAPARRRRRPRPNQTASRRSLHFADRRAGDDVSPYHHRQIIVLLPASWRPWLEGAPERDLLQAQRNGALSVCAAPRG